MQVLACQCLGLGGFSYSVGVPSVSLFAARSATVLPEGRFWSLGLTGGPQLGRDLMALHSMADQERGMLALILAPRAYPGCSGLAGGRSLGATP